jgi:hypothetical protein
MYTWKTTICIELALKINLYFDRIGNEQQSKKNTQDLGHGIREDL